MSKTIPYFDLLLSEFAEGNERAVKAFGHHVHWGYWENPSQATLSIEEFFQASEKLCRLVCEGGAPQNGMKLLDVGCGFGGTIASLNERFSQAEFTGLNIDPRQLARAREEVRPRVNNQINFVEGNACALPFSENSFDTVLAVECIFHFPSRAIFFKEVARVLKTGGRFSLSDFVRSKKSNFFSSWLERPLTRLIEKSYGTSDRNVTLQDYRDMAREAGFKVILEQDITRQTLPTYPIVMDLFRHSKHRPFGALFVTRLLAWVSRLGVTRYLILSFEKL